MAGFLRRLFGGGRKNGLSLHDYALFLETSHWTSPVEPTITRARVPQITPRLPGIKAVIWDVYGTLLYCHHEGESRRFLEETDAVGEAFEVTVEHFRMWPAMSKSRLSPGAYLWNQFQELAGQVVVEKNVRGNEHPEINLGNIWHHLIQRLQKGGFAYDAGVLGPPPSFAQKVALFCDETLERTALFPGAREALTALKERGILQGLACDGQVYTGAQLVKALARAGGARSLGAYFDPMLCSFSYEVSVARPAPALYRALLKRLRDRGIEPREVLIVGNNLGLDVALPAAMGCRTALFAGSADTVRLQQDSGAAHRARPDAMIIEMEQVVEVAAG